MKKSFLIRFLVGDKPVATIYPTPQYAGRHLMADLQELALLHGQPIKVEIGPMSPLQSKKKRHNMTLFPVAEHLDSAS